MSTKRIDRDATNYIFSGISERQKRNIKRQMAQDRSLARTVEDLQACFDPIDDNFRLVTPAGEAWESIVIEKRKQFYLWAGILACSAAITCAVIWFFTQPRVLYNAELDSEGHTIATMEVRNHNDLVLTGLALAQAPAGKDFELWVIPAASAPKPLGVLSYGGTATLHSAVSMKHAKMAITMEPKGGSPTGQPTGPVIVIGELHRL